jgi:hypothetical protein
LRDRRADGASVRSADDQEWRFLSMNSGRAFTFSRLLAVTSLIVVVGVVSHHGGAQGMGPEALVFPSAADTYVDASDPAGSFGAAERLRADSSPERITYLRFNVSGVGGRTVPHAILRLQVSGPSAETGGTLYRVSDSSWDEGTITYDSRPALDGPPIEVLGGVAAGEIVEMALDGIVTGDGIYDFALSSTSDDGVHYVSTAGSGQPPELVLTVPSGPEPVVTILQPPGGASFFRGDAVPFQATAVDEADGVLDDEIMWASDRDGALGRGQTVAPVLSEGDHAITASVTDSDGFSSADQIDLTIVPPPPDNTAPLVAITSPLDGQVIGSGAAVAFRGTATDLEDGTLTDDLAWTSDQDGPIGDGERFTTSLSDGRHDVTATVRDSGGLVGMATVRFEVVATEDLDGFVAIADAYVDAKSKNTNYGSSVELRADLDAVRISYLRFDVTGIGQSTVVGARILTDVASGSSSGSDRGGVLHFLSPHGWDEDTVTYSTRPSVDGPELASVGRVSAGDTVAFDVSAVVRGDGIHDFALLGGSDDAVAYRSRESSSGAPRLVVTLDANETPVVDIRSPDPGTQVPVGSAVTFDGRATDAEDGDLRNGIVWRSDLDGSLGTGARRTVTLRPGDHRITASATDGDGATGLAETTVSVGSAPVVTILAPSDGTIVSATDPLLTFEGAAIDVEDGNIRNRLSWTSDRDGHLGNGRRITVSLNPGLHTITAAVTDSHGRSADARIAVTVRPPNTPPRVTITAPSDGAALPAGAGVTMVATVEDDFDQGLEPGIAWTSDRDGSLGGGAQVTRLLSEGNHRLTATVTDRDGAAGTASIVVTVTPTPPAVTILTPGDGARVVIDDPVMFAGQAIDPTEGDLSTGLVWTSDLDGPIGAGAGFTIATLSEGIHRIAASAADSGGRVGSGQVTLTVAPPSAPPDVTIVDPDAGAVVARGQWVELTARVQDPEDGNISHLTRWTSSRNGFLGTGASLRTSGLSRGVHQLTASVVDSTGVDGSASVTIEVATGIPAVHVLLPAPGAGYLRTTPIRLYATAQDGTDGDVSQSLTWTSDRDGVLGVGQTLVAQGLSVGAHTVSVVATTSRGARGMAWTRLVVSPPTASVVAAGDAYVDDGEPDLNFGAISELMVDAGPSAREAYLRFDVTDVDGLDLTAAQLELVVASKGASDRGGTVYSFSGGGWAEDTVTFNTRPVIDGPALATVAAAVEPGDAVAFDLTSTVTDAGSYHLALVTPSTDAARYKSREASSGRPTLHLALAQRPVEDLPSLTIGAPESGLLAFDDTSIVFDAAAHDPQDGDLSHTVTWTSNRDGFLGTGASISQRLSRGAHTITASVTDSFGLMAHAAVEVTVTNRPPAVSITAPLSHDLFPVGFPVAAAATAHDGDDGDLSATIRWTSHADGDLGTGRSITTPGLSSGDHIITATVTNSFGTIGSDSVLVFIGQAPPQVTIDSPSEAITLGEGVNVLFSGSAADLEDGDLSGTLEWASDLEGVLGGGQTIATALMVNGLHTITASATDSHGFTRSATVLVTVTPAPPAITITSPIDGNEITGPIGFAASAIDARDGDRSAGITWTSSIDGALGNGPVLAALQLSPGVHDITASASDDDGLVGSARVTIVVGIALPDVEIVEPVSSAGPLGHATVDPDAPVTLTATAFDVLGQNIGAALVWHSDLSGVLGTGPSIVVSGLIRGSHVITAEATDGNGITGSALILLLVVDAGGSTGPLVTVSAPPPDTTVDVGVQTTFAASALDSAGADLSGDIIWVSNLDGLLGAGPSIAGTLRSVGTHVVTASVADDSGLVGGGAVTVEAVLPSRIFDAVADTYDDDSAPGSNFGASTELLVGTDPGRRIFLRFDVTGLGGLAIERAIVQLQTTSNGDAGSDSGGVIHRVADAGWGEGALTHATSPAVDGALLDVAGAVVPSQTVEFDVTPAISGDGTYAFAIVPAADETIYRSRESAFGRPTLIVSLAPPVFEHPHVKLLEPADQATLPAGQPVLCRGTSYDDQDGDLDVAIIWRSDIDGPLAIGPEVSLRLSPGAHVLMATVSDVDGNPSADAVRVFVGDRPIVKIDLPADGTEAPFGEHVVFGGSAFDPQEGDLSTLLAWSSDRDGPLVVGPSMARALSPGTHTITAEVTDADGNTGRATISVTVTADNVGFRDFDFGAGVDADSNRITASKPESKLWHVDGIWWATLFSPILDAYSIHRLDIATQTWVDTHVVIDARPGSRQDALLDGNRLYLLSRVMDLSDQNRLLRYTYHPDVQTFVLDPGFPVDVPGAGTESMTIAKDETGRLWGAYTLNDTVMVTHTLGSDTAWAIPFVVPVADEDPDAAAVSFDDIAAVQHIDGAIGVLWSNQLTRELYFAVHDDGTATEDPAAWRLEVAATGGSVADDHFNMKLASDGRLFAAVKTGFTSSSATLVGLLVRAPDGSWSPLHRVTTARYHATRPLCMLDETRGRIHVFYSPFEGAIYTKSSDIDAIAFDEGIGTPFITSRSTGFINNPTGTKQNVDAETGLVVVAASKSAYWHNTVDPEPAPAVRITAPGDGFKTLPGTAIGLSATALSLIDGILTHQIAWTSSLDGALGVGGALTLLSPSLGEHLIAASVTDSTGITGRAQVRISVEHDAPPVVVIDSPGTGARFLTGEPITFGARAIDSLEGDLSSALEWRSDRDGGLGTGASIAVGTLSLGTHVVTAEATDSAGLRGSTLVVVDVQQAAPPEVQITSPAGGSTFSFGGAIPFVGLATDVFDGNLGPALRWASNRDGAIGTGASFARSSLSAGVHTITATVTDSHGLMDAASVTITVGSASRIAITSPSHGATFGEGSAIVFSGTATDLDGDDLGASINWLSNRDGAIGVGRSVTVDTLSAGAHLITAGVTDLAGTPHTAQIGVTIEANGRPVVTMEAPTGSEQWLSSHAVVLSAGAWDPEDGDLRGQIAWTSDRDGSLGMGSPLLVSSLSAGTHLLTAAVTDLQGGRASASVSLPVLAGTLEVMASEDTYVDAGQPNGVLGAAEIVRADAFTLREAFLRFQVPDQAPLSIERVELRLMVASGGSHGSASGGSIHVLTDTDWSEATTTFATRPGIDQPALDTMGPVSSGDTVDFDMTGVVVGSGAYAFALTNPTSDSVGYRSREASSGQPRLRITRTQALGPAVFITAPRAETTIPTGTPIALQAAALDPEDGDVATSASWHSDQQGALGAGARLTVVLQPGTHTISVTVTDAQGLSGHAQIVLNISG